MKFTKMHGCGNDYVYVNGFEERIEDPASLAVEISDRHFGVGSDGLILILPSEKADFRMRMFNSDGSEAEMCGNGIRCVAKYVYDHWMTEETRLRIETLGGVKTLELDVSDGKMQAATVDMGVPGLDRAAIPMTGPPGRVIDEELSAGGRTFKVTCASMGNPHCIVLVDDTDNYPVERYGPLIECHERFPSKANVEFVEVLSDDEVKLRVWERGSGETLACGTGASATVVACSLTGKTGREITAHLTGGDLLLKWAEDDHVYMTGPATEVFSGEWDGNRK